MAGRFLGARLREILQTRDLVWPPEAVSKYDITCVKTDPANNKKTRETIAIDDLVQELQESYQDYRRHKVGALRNALQSVFADLNSSYADLCSTVFSEPGMKRRQEAEADPQDSGPGGGAGPQQDMDLDEPVLNLNGRIRKNYKMNPKWERKRPKDKLDPDRTNERQQTDDPSVAAEHVFIPEIVKHTKLSDMGGIDRIRGEIEDLVIKPLKYPQLYKHLGVQPTKGVLLHGPPGSGKSKLAEAIAGEIGCPLFRVAATEIVTGMSGESENRLRSLFNQAKECAPSIIFLDEMDSITPKRENTFREMEKRIVAQLGICMDGLQDHFVIGRPRTRAVIGATNRQEYVDPMIRRNGRFDREISMGIPNLEARADILKVRRPHAQALSAKIRVGQDVDFEEIANLTPGFVGADLQAALRESAICAISRLFRTTDMSLIDDEKLEALFISRDDFIAGIAKVQPSAKREGFATIPDVTWSSIGALTELKAELEKQIVFPIKFKKLYRRFGVGESAGVLLYGPPGCGKTLLAKAISNECKANFISIKGRRRARAGPEILNKYVGESEKAIRLIFQRAAISAPCIIFFDEVDSLCSVRNDSNQVNERIVNQLLTEMDGIQVGAPDAQNREYVYIIAATNRPDIIDPAILRPGRLEKLFYVPLPNRADRVDILAKLTAATPKDAAINFDFLAENTAGFSGADLASLCREASISAIEEIRLSIDAAALDYRAAAPEHAVVRMDHFTRALAKVRPSVKQYQIDFYEEFRAKYS